VGMNNIEYEAVAGAWRSLCIGVLLQGIQRVEADSKLFKRGSRYKTDGLGGLDKELLNQRVQAREWIAGGIGTITFEECCEAVGVDPGWTRKKVEEWCRERRRRPLSDWTFGDSSLTKSPSAG